MADWLEKASQELDELGKAEIEALEALGIAQPLASTSAKSSEDLHATSNATSASSLLNATPKATSAKSSSSSTARSDEPIVDNEQRWYNNWSDWKAADTDNGDDDASQHSEPNKMDTSVHKGRRKTEPLRASGRHGSRGGVNRDFYKNKYGYKGWGHKEPK